MKHSKLLSLPCALFFCLLLATSCTHENVSIATAPVLPLIRLKTSPVLGSYLTDSLGNSLYYFSNDFDGRSNCTGGCLNVWPIYFGGDNLAQSRLATGLDIADFGTITTASGAKQTTYKTWPLYFYSPQVNGINVRELPGETKGEAVNNIWFVAKPDYTIMLVNTQLIGLNGKSYKKDYTEGVGKTLYFSDPKGNTLYGFAPDSFNINKYTKPDFSNNATWPLYENEKVVVPSILDKTLFGTATVFGKKQLTYQGWPMYYFGPDSLIRGLNKGVSVPRPGIWPVMVKEAVAAPK